MGDIKQTIPTLSPILFRKRHIQNNLDELLSDENISQFFIHSFQDNDVKLSLPLPPHKKTVNDFVFITKGSMTRNLGIESFQLQKNDFLFTPKNSITTTEQISEDLEGYFCHFSDEFMILNPLIGNFSAQTNQLNFSHVSESEAHNLAFLLGRILELYKARIQEPKNNQIISFYLSTFLAELFLISQNQPIAHQQKNTISTAYINLVHQQFKENLSLKEYAALLHITPNHLNKLVKGETGKTASEIIKEITILEAKVLLLQTQMTISEISAELGFDDASYFSRFFKNETHSSPLNYRKMIDLS